MTEHTEADTEHRRTQSALRLADAASRLLTGDTDALYDIANHLHRQFTWYELDKTMTPQDANGVLDKIERILKVAPAEYTKREQAPPDAAASFAGWSDALP